MIQLILWPLSGLAYLFHCLPLSIQKLFAWFIGFMWFDVLRIRRDTAIKNVMRVFPKKNHKDAVRLARISLYHMGRTIVEFISFPFLWKNDFQKIFDIQGEEHYQKALAQGKGAFILGVHLGNGDLGIAAMASRGYKLHVISKIFKSKWLNDLWFSAREAKGVGFIPPRKSSYEILKALKRKETVVFVLDQYTGPPNGILTTFFNIEIGTAQGLALFAQRSGAPVVPMYTYRKCQGRHQIVIEPPIEFEEKENKEETIRFMTEKYNRWVEKAVLTVPEQWMWVHRRWKLGFKGQNFSE